MDSQGRLTTKKVMNKESLIKINQYVFLGLLWALPLINSHDMAAFMSGGYYLFDKICPDQNHKVVKDVGYWTLLILGLCLVPKHRWLSLEGFIFISGALLVALFALTTRAEHPWMAYFGIRWALPLLLIFPLASIVSPKLLTQVANVCILVFFIHIACQYLEWLMIGTKYSYLDTRPTGVFAKPNTSAFYALFTSFMAQYYTDSKPTKIITHLLVAFSLVLSKSGTGIFCWLMFLSIEFLKHCSLRTILTLTPIAIMTGWKTMLFTAQRGDYFQGSFVPRLEFMKQAFLEASWWPNLFGKATNASWHFYPELQHTLIPFGVDSTFAAILYNSHKIGFIFIALLYVFWLFHLIRNPSAQTLALTMMVTLFAFTTDVLEVFPVNLLVALLIAQHLKQHSKHVAILSQSSKALPNIAYSLK